MSIILPACLPAVASILGIVTLSHSSNTTRTIKPRELIFQSVKYIYYPVQLDWDRIADLVV